jgi:hypothetical protein
LRAIGAITIGPSSYKEKEEREGGFAGWVDGIGTITIKKKD